MREMGQKGGGVAGGGRLSTMRVIIAGSALLKYEFAVNGDIGRGRIVAPLEYVWRADACCCPTRGKALQYRSEFAASLAVDRADSRVRADDFKEKCVLRVPFRLNLRA
jgi:hypothetical protein